MSLAKAVEAGDVLRVRESLGTGESANDAVRDGRTVLTWAVEFGNVPSIRALLEGGGDATKGDVVLFRTGWNSLWKTNHLGRPAGQMVKNDEQLAKDKAEFGSGEPGVAPEVCEYLAAKKISMIGSDTWGLSRTTSPRVCRNRSPIAT